MLKILEEPPEYVIFLFATTDPQKIIGTIMSRVQRFNFKRISTQGIVNRLKWIIEQENNEREVADVSSIVYEDSAVQYIARLAKGGMRDGITTLEKCLDYSTNLTLDVVLKVTSGGVTEETMLHFLQLLLTKNVRESLLYFNEIYMSGIDIPLFIKMFWEFLENCVKYLLTQSVDIVTLMDITTQWLDKESNCLNDIKSFLFTLLNIRTTYSNEDLKIIVESWVIQVCN